jgi:hypothetical protein
MAHIINGSGNLNTFPDIHQVCDGKLFNYGIVKNRYSNEDKHRIISSLINLVNEEANPEIKIYGIHGLSLIKNNIGTLANYQAMDDISADDVVVEICDLLSKELDKEVLLTVTNHIAEQLKDSLLSSGTCPTGLTSRMYNIYMFLRDKNDGVHLPKSS